MVSAHSDLDDAGEIVTPTPRVKRILSSSRCLPHIAQVTFHSVTLCSLCTQWHILMNRGFWSVREYMYVSVYIYIYTHTKTCQCLMCGHLSLGLQGFPLSECLNLDTNH